MRLRRVLTASLGTGMLVLAVPAAANAATPTAANAVTGDFSYRFVDGYGIRQESILIDPPSRECVNLPEVADPKTSAPAYAPRNRADATAIVFTKPDCRGEYHSLRPLTGHGSDQLKLRSVLFS